MESDWGSGRLRGTEQQWVPRTRSRIYTGISCAFFFAPFPFLELIFWKKKKKQTNTETDRESEREGEDQRGVERAPVGTEQLPEGRACKEAAGVSQGGWEGRGSSSYQPPTKQGLRAGRSARDPASLCLQHQGPGKWQSTTGSLCARDLAEETALKVRGYKREAEGCGSRSDA